MTVTQSQNASFTLTTADCANVAAVSPPSGAGPFAFMPIGVGTCSYRVTGAGGAFASIGITVTTTTIVTSNIRRSRQ